MIISEDEVKRVKGRHEDELLSLKGVQGVGISEDHGQAVIAVYVLEESTADIPSTLEGVPVRVEETDTFLPF